MLCLRTSGMLPCALQGRSDAHVGVWGPGVGRGQGVQVKGVSFVGLIHRPVWCMAMGANTWQSD